MITEIHDVEHLFTHRMKFADPKSKRQRGRDLATFLEVFPEFMMQAAEKKEFTNDELRSFGYYDYLVSRLNRIYLNPLKKKGERRVFKIMRDGVALFHDIKDYGLKNPLDMYLTSNGNFRLARGGRRLIILRILGHDTVPVRIFENRNELAADNTKLSWEPG